MERHKSINIHPGVILLEDVIKPLNLTISEAAGLLDVSRLTLSKIVNAKGAITPNIAIRISLVFGGKADFWLRMQRNYDLRKAEDEFKKKSVILHRYKVA